MASLNKATIIGNLGKDPELRETKGGKAVVSFSVATTSKVADKETTEWHSIVAWDKTAEACSKYLMKGSPVYVEGRIQTSTYEKDGQKRYKTEIVANQVLFLGQRDKAETKAPVVAKTSAEFDEIPF